MSNNNNDTVVTPYTTQSNAAIILGTFAVIAFFGIIAGTMFMIFDNSLKSGGALLSESETSKETSLASEEIKHEPVYTYEEKVETQSIAYSTEYKYDNTLEVGKQKVVRYGVNGTKTIKYKVTYKDNAFVSKEKKSESVTKQPVNQVIAKGTKNVWHCVDATSYDKNPYNDNYCEDSYGNYRYVSDSTARMLDPSYYPGQSGHPYYNSF